MIFTMNHTKQTRERLHVNDRNVEMVSQKAWNVEKVSKILSNLIAARQTNDRNVEMVSK